MSNYVRGPDGEIIDTRTGMPTGGYASHAALSPVEIVQSQFIRRDQQAKQFSSGRMLNRQEYEQSMAAAHARAVAQLAAQRQREAQEAAAEAAAHQQSILEQKGLLGADGRPKENDPWFDSLLGIGVNNTAMQGNNPLMPGSPPAGQSNDPGNPMQNMLNLINNPSPIGGGQATGGLAGAMNSNVANANSNLGAAYDAAQINKQGAQVRDQTAGKGVANIDPAVDKYQTLLGQYEQQSEGALYQGGSTNPNNPLASLLDGNTGTSTNSGSSTSSNLSVTYSSLAGKGFGYVLMKDPDTGKLTVESAATAMEKISATAQKDPAQAADLMVSLAAMGAYQGGADSYVQNRLFMKGGKLQGTWTRDDITALANGLGMAVQDQSAQIEADPTKPQGIQDIISNMAGRNQNLASVGSVGNYGGKKGYRSKGYSSYGGGGYGGGGAANPLDPSIIANLGNQQSQTMIGRNLTPQEMAAFVQYYTAETTSGKFSESYASESVPSIMTSFLKSQSGLNGEYQANSYAGFYEALANMIKGNSNVGQAMH